MPRKFSEDQTRKQMKVPSFFGGANLQLGVHFVEYCCLSNDQNHSIFARFESVFLQKLYLDTAG